MEYLKKSSWSKYLSSVHKSEETILKREFHKCFALRFLSECSKKKRKIFHSQIYSGEFFLHLLDAHTILSVKKYPSV